MRSLLTGSYPEYQKEPFFLKKSHFWPYIIPDSVKCEWYVYCPSPLCREMQHRECNELLWLYLTVDLCLPGASRLSAPGPSNHPALESKGGGPVV